MPGNSFKNVPNDLVINLDVFRSVVILRYFTKTQEIIRISYIYIAPLVNALSRETARVPRHPCLPVNSRYVDSDHRVENFVSYSDARSVFISIVFIHSEFRTSVA